MTIWIFPMIFIMLNPILNSQSILLDLTATFSSDYFFFPLEIWSFSHLASSSPHSPYCLSILLATTSKSHLLTSLPFPSLKMLKFLRIYLFSNIQDHGLNAVYMLLYPMFMSLILFSLSLKSKHVFPTIRFMSLFLHWNN